MNAEDSALVQRFEGFLAKIDARLKEIIAEAEQGVGGLLAQYPDDTLPLGNAMSGLDHRVRELKKKLDDTWSSDIEPKYSARGNEMHDVALDRKRDFEVAFDEAWTSWKARAYRAFYENLWPLAEAAMKRPVACTRCGAPLALTVRHESSSTPCPHCRAVNQVLPDKAVATYFSGAPHAFADEAAMPLRFAVERERVRVDRARRGAGWADEPLESLTRWEQMERAFWTKYAETKARVAGGPPDQELVESRMALFRKLSLENKQFWQRAHGRARA
jgi:phage FluMu protein Com